MTKISTLVLSALFIGMSAVLPLSALAAGEVTSATTITYGSKPTVSGTSDEKKVVITVTNEKGKTVFKSKEIKVTVGEWKTKITKKLPVGSYGVTLKSVSKGKPVLDTSPLTIAKKGAKVGGTITTSMLPLLGGGMAASGTSVPVAYVKVTNTGTATTSIHGFTLVQNGSAPTSAVIGFTTNDDKGGSRTTIGGTEGFVAFKKGSAVIPLEVSIGPKQVRVYTIKAILSKASYAFAGKQLKLDVASIDTDAKVTGVYPIRGTTWTLK